MGMRIEIRFSTPADEECSHGIGRSNNSCIWYLLWSQCSLWRHVIFRQFKFSWKCGLRVSILLTKKLFDYSTQMLHMWHVFMQWLWRSLVFECTNPKKYQVVSQPSLLLIIVSADAPTQSPVICILLSLCRVSLKPGHSSFLHFLIRAYWNVRRAMRGDWSLS